VTAQDARGAKGVASFIERSRAVLSHGATHRMLVGSIVAGLGAYGYQVIGARVLGDVAYAPISVLWTIQYLVLSVVLYSIESYVTRLTALDLSEAVGLRRVVARLLLACGALAVLLTALTYVFRDALFQGMGDLAVVAGLTVMGYASFVVVRALFAGADRFGAYGISTALESVARLALAVPVLLLFGTSRSLAWITPVGAFVAAAWWFVGNRIRPPATPPRWREAGRRRTNPLQFLGLTTAANAAAQALLAAGPLVLIALGSPPATVSVFFITTTAARAPLVLAYGGLLSRVMPRFTRMAEAGAHRALRRAATATLLVATGLATGGGVAAAVAGPAVVALFFGEAFRPAWWLVGGAVAGVLLATGAAILNQVLIAMGHERRLVVPWAAALAVAASAILLVPGDPDLRVLVGFVVAEVVALTTLRLAIQRVTSSVDGEPA
jgi:O-antigen/teichoic acid export membrane protein